MTLSSPAQPQPFDLPSLIRQALREIQHDAATLPAWRTVRLFRQTTAARPGRNDRQIVNYLLDRAIERLAQSNPTQARILRLHFFDRYAIHRIAAEINLAESSTYAQQRAAIHGLVELLVAQEEAARAEQQARLAQRMPPPPYQRLIGRDPRLEELLRLAIAPRPPWLLSIEGIGGIGKTSLAYALLQQAVATGFTDEIAWVTAQDTLLSGSGVLLPAATPAFTTASLTRHLLHNLMPETLGGSALSVHQMQEMLLTRLHQTPHLIVVDNLERAGDLHLLLPLLHSLVNPSKVILTTREGLAGEMGVYPLALTELDQAHALALLRQEAASSNLPDVTIAADATLLPLYDTVGGNPLALRLAVGLLHIQSLPSLIDDLRAARGAAVDNLFTFIYHRAWASLDEGSRHALLSMAVLPPQGDTLDYLEQICELSADALRSALQQLVRLNLVEVRGDFQRRIYTLHGLTRTFLIQQVAKWM